MKKIIFLLAVVILAVGGGAYFKWNYAADPQSKFLTAAIKSGDVTSSISATGTVQPEEVIDVGSQVTGKIVEFGRDPRGLPNSTSPDKEKYKDKFVDYCTPVEEKDLLVQIDPTVYQAQRDQAAANLLRANADLKQFEAKFAQAKSEWERAQKLAGIPATTKAISDSDFDLAKANYEAAKANIDVGKAVIEQGKAALEMADRNLGYTTIVSPVKGVVIDRRVNAGQTVVANMSVQSLFLLAKDLSKMEVWASVNEADIGRIRNNPEMPVRFTVDAYPNEVFLGHVEQIRYNAQMNQTVVTYTVVVGFDNSDLKVLPYMTANLRFEVDRHEDVILVPNAALRWRPREEQIVPELREEMAAALMEKIGKDDPALADSSDDKTAAKVRGGKAEKTPKEVEGRGRLWIEEGDFLRPLEVHVGLTDGTTTEVIGDELKVGMEVVIGEKTADQSSDTTNPFMPKIFNRKSFR
ncbi:MAG: efflux RND transporter periplasmic adaptor subunit [Pirellulales bacterium]|nr:efflux RND transporter periplasmic adaptor subunit [Pirellulales bacterium]